MYNMRPTCIVYVVWHHFIPEPSTSFSQVLWSVLWLCHQLVTDVTAWLINPNPSCSKNRKEKKKKIEWKEKIKMKSTVNDFDRNGIRRSMLRSVRTDPNQSALKWTAILINDCEKPQDLFTKHSQEPSLSQHPSQNLSPFWHHLILGTSMVWNPKNTQYLESWGRFPHGLQPSPQLDFLCQNSFEW